MKVLALGAGVMGAGGIRALQHFPDLEIESLVIADLNKDAADALAKDLNFPNVSTVQLDVTDSKQVTKLAKEADLVFNAVGPFTNFAKGIMEAVIEAGTDYVDVCDDGDAAAFLLDFNDKAKEAGITGIICTGQTPGVANMQSKYLADKLDEVENLKICWYSGSPPVDMVRGTDNEEIIQIYYDMFADKEVFKKASLAGWNHHIHSTTGDITVWKGGKYVDIRAWEDGEYIDFAEPLGRVPVFYIAHAEPSTLPRFIDIKDSCVCLGGWTLEPEVREEARGHRDPLNPPVDPGTPLWKPPAQWKDKGVWQGQAAIAEGVEDGKKVRYTTRYMCSVYDKGAFTFAGQAVAIYLMSKMKDMPKGIYAPEGILDAGEFLNETLNLHNRMNGWNFTLDEFIPTEREVLD